MSENISCAGFYFVSFKEYKIGQTLECWIKMPGVKNEGKWDARVVRCEELNQKMKVADTYGVAVEFVKSFDTAETDLKKTLENITSKNSS